MLGLFFSFYLTKVNRCGIVKEGIFVGVNGERDSFAAVKKKKKPSATTPYSNIDGLTTMHGLSILLELLVCLLCFGTTFCLLSIWPPTQERDQERKKEGGYKEKKQQHIFYAAELFLLQKESKWPFIPIAAYGTFPSVDPINFNTLVLPCISKLPSHFWCLLVP